MSPAPKPHLAVEVVDGVAVVSFLEKQILKEEKVDEIREQISRLIGDGGHNKVLLNLGNLEYVISMFLATLMNVHKRLAEAGGQFRICNVDHHDIQELLKTYNYVTFLNIDKDEVTALAKF